MAELEAALQKRFDLETLAVYGDALVARNDPRGELIAIDLQIRMHGITKKLHQARQRLLGKWLGDDLALFERMSATFEFGFISNISPIRYIAGKTVKDWRRILKTPASEFLRGITIRDSDESDSVQLTELAARPRPWLHRLTIRSFPAMERFGDALRRATPNLEILEIDGHNLFGKLLHPSVQHLKAFHPYTFEQLRGRGPRLAIRSLELRDPFDDMSNEKAAGLPSPARLPALRELDLSRSTVVSGWRNPFKWLHAQPIKRQLRVLRLPEVVGDNISIAQRAIDDMPELEHVVIRRSEPSRTVPLTHRTARIELSQWPTAIHGRQHFFDLWAGRTFLADFELPTTAEYLERHAPAMPLDVRAAWRTIFDTLEAADTTRVKLPTDAVIRAFDGIDLATCGSIPHLEEIRRVLRERLGKSAAVVIDTSRAR